MTIESTLNVSNPVRDDEGNDRVTCYLMPRVDNYPHVANAIESVCSDPGAFQELVHERKSPVWTVVLVDGTRLEDVSEFLADRFNGLLPDNVRAVAENNIVSPFEEDEDTVTSDHHEAILRGLFATALRTWEEAVAARVASSVAEGRAKSTLDEIKALLEAL